MDVTAAAEARAHGVWLEIPRHTHVRARLSGAGDIHVMVADLNLVFERSVLVRLVDVAGELLAAFERSATAEPTKVVVDER